MVGYDGNIEGETTVAPCPWGFNGFPPDVLRPIPQRLTWVAPSDLDVVTPAMRVARYEFFDQEGAVGIYRRVE